MDLTRKIQLSCLVALVVGTVVLIILANQAGIIDLKRSFSPALLGFLLVFFALPRDLFNKHPGVQRGNLNTKEWAILIIGAGVLLPSLLIGIYAVLTRSYGG